MDCCTNDGCNWNLTTASGDLTWSDYTGGASLPSSSATVASARLRLYQTCLKSGYFGNLLQPGYNFAFLLFQHRELLDSVVHNRSRRRRPPLLPLLLLLHQVRNGCFFQNRSTVLSVFATHSVPLPLNHKGN